MSQKEYNEAVQEALDFIRGGTSDSVRTLTEKMNEAAENLDFELAARIRDRITAINKLKERQKVVASRVPEQDVIALVLGGEKVSIQVFRFAGGRLYDRESFLLNADDEPEQIRSEFVMQYYSMRDKIPPVITIDGPVNDDGVLEEWLTKKAERRVKFHIPQKGEQKQLVEMCRTNAAEALAQAMGRATGRETSALDELRQLLNLPKTPEYIESYDISNLAGGENVAGMIVFENGRPLKSAYRKFKIKTVVGQDDYGSMREVIRRRFEEYPRGVHAGVEHSGRGAPLCHRLPPPAAQKGDHLHHAHVHSGHRRNARQSADEALYNHTRRQRGDGGNAGGNARHERPCRPRRLPLFPQRRKRRGITLFPRIFRRFSAKTAQKRLTYFYSNEIIT